MLQKNKFYQKFSKDFLNPRVKLLELKNNTLTQIEAEIRGNIQDKKI